MIILLGMFALAIVVFIVAIIINVRSRGRLDDNGSGWAFGGVIILSCTLLVLFIHLPIHRAGIMSDVREFIAVEETVVITRNNESISEYELAALQHKIIDYNAWLANIQFWATNPVGKWYTPKAVLLLKPIR